MQRASEHIVSPLLERFGTNYVTDLSSNLTGAIDMQTGFYFAYKFRYDRCTKVLLKILVDRNLGLP